MGAIVGIGEDTGSAAAAYATTNVRDLADAQASMQSSSVRRLRSHPAPAASSAPLDLAIVDFVTASRAELVEHTRSYTDVTAPVPREHADIIAWYGQHSPHLDEGARQAGEAMVYRQGLEAAVLARNTTAIRREFCPSCGCLSLKWVPPLQAAVCLNTKYDADEHGRPRRFTLGQIAAKVVEDLTFRAAT